jgi:hypothetical protein
MNSPADDRDQARARDVMPTLLVLAALAFGSLYLLQVIARTAGEQLQFAAVTCCDEPAGGNGFRALLHSRRLGNFEVRP